MDYSKCVIYRISSNDGNNQTCYIGHTTSLKQRRHAHKAREDETRKYMEENGGLTNWEIIQIESYPCKNYDEANRRTRYWKDEYKVWKLPI
jgi:predicted GIY-YIG superfamily endonuclease